MQYRRWLPSLGGPDASIVRLEVAETFDSGQNLKGEAKDSSQMMTATYNVRPTLRQNAPSAYAYLQSYCKRGPL
jgi:hypothetical protein